MRETAKPCPFCGAQPMVVPWPGGGRTGHLVRCFSTQCTALPRTTGATKVEAVERWNRRAPDAAPDVDYASGLPPADFLTVLAMHVREFLREGRARFIEEDARTLDALAATAGQDTARLDYLASLRRVRGGFVYESGGRGFVWLDGDGSLRDKLDAVMTRAAALTTKEPTR